MSYRVDESTQDIVISGFQNGVGASPLAGLTDVKGVNVSTIPGEASVSFATESLFKCPSGTGLIGSTVTASNYFLAPTSVKLETSQWILITNPGTSGLSTSTPYWLLSSGSDGFGNYRYELFPSNGTFPPSSSQATISANSAVTYSIISPSEIRFFSKSISNNFALDSNGRVWTDIKLTGYEGSGPTATNSWVYFGNTVETDSNGNGMVLYQTVNPNSTGGYDEWLFVFTKGQIDYCPITTNTIAATYTWVNGWNPFKGTSGNSSYLLGVNVGNVSHHAIVTPDGRVNVCDGQNLLVFYQNIPQPGQPYVAFNPLSYATALTLTGLVNAGATSATLSSGFSGTTGWYQTQFSNGQIINVYYTNSGTAIQFATALVSQVGTAISTAGTYVAINLNTILPENDTAQCLSFVNEYLLIGGKKNVIYPWDLDPADNEYTPPLILLPESNVQCIVTVGQNAYIFAGNRGNIYITNGSQANWFVKVPDHISGSVEPLFSWGGPANSSANTIAAYPNCATYNKNRLYFGVSGFLQNPNSAVSNYGGIWCLDVNTQGLNQVQQMSYGTWNGYVSAILTDVANGTEGIGPNNGYGLVAGWTDGNGNYAIDGNISTPYTGGQSWITSDLIPIGTLLHKTTPTQFEVKLSTPLVSGETIQIKVGQYLDMSYASFSSVGTMSYSSDPTQSNISWNSSEANGSPIEGLQWILVQVILTSTASSPSYNRLTEIRIVGGAVKQTSLSNIE